ncbi:MAG: ABC transporter substrate-binding protein [bacterium]
MKKRIAKVIVLFLAFAAVAGVTGCKQQPKTGPGGVIELQFWGGWTGPDGKAMEQIVKSFNEKNKDVKVTLTTFQWDPLFNKFLMSMRAGNAPDVIAMHQTDIPQYAAMNVLEPMDEAIAKAGLKPEDFDAGAWEGFKYKGKMLALPLDIHMFAMYYNKDMFKKAGLDPEKPPVDGASLIEAAKKLTITGPDGKVSQYGVGVPATHQHAYRYWYSLLYQDGGQFMSPKGKAAFNSKQGVEAYQFLYNLVYKEKVAPEQETDVAKDFQSQKVAMIFEGPWWVPGMSEVKGLNFGTARFPKIFAKQSVWANSHGLCLPMQKNADPKRREATLRLLKFISDNSLDWAKGGQIPVRKSVSESAEFKAITLLKPFVDSVPDAVYLPKLEKGSMIFASNASTPMMTAMQEVMLDQKKPKEALDIAAKQVDAILAGK